MSFDTVTYRDLGHFLTDNNPCGYKLSRLDPYEFLQSDQHSDGHYINLITREMQLRQLVTEKLDVTDLDRFSLVHDQSYTSGANIGAGCMIYPMVSMYTNTTLVKDNIVHSLTMIAHDCVIGAGSYVSAGVNIGGTTKIGNFCQIGIGAVIFDKINITDHVIIGADTLVCKSIVESGVYINKSKSDLDKIK